MTIPLNRPYSSVLCECDFVCLYIQGTKRLLSNSKITATITRNFVHFSQFLCKKGLLSNNPI